MTSRVRPIPQLRVADTGEWTGPHEAVQGAEWYRRASERGHAEAQYSLGFMYLRGEGIEPDPARGLEWLRRSADQGDESAIRLLADVYREGQFGIPVDAAGAQKWQEKFRNTELYRLRSSVGVKKEHETSSQSQSRAIVELSLRSCQCAHRRPHFPPQSGSRQPLNFRLIAL